MRRPRGATPRHIYIIRGANEAVSIKNIAERVVEKKEEEEEEKMS